MGDVGSVAEVLSSLHKSYGESIATKGTHHKDCERVPTGIFDFDYATGGGFCRGKMNLVFGPESCLAPDTHIQYAIRDQSGRVQNSKGGTLERLWHRFHRIPMLGKGNYLRTQTEGSYITVPSMGDDGAVFHNPVVDVVRVGSQMTYRLTTDSGASIVATEDHKFFTGLGYKPLKELNPGDEVYAHQSTRVVGQKYVRPRDEWFVKFHSTAPIKVVNGCAYHRLSVSRGCYEASMNEMSPEDYREALNQGFSGKVIPEGLHVHHLDEDWTNNEIQNLMLISPRDHGQLHASERIRNLSFIAVPTTIVSIVPEREQQTFDVKMAAPFNNFVADGLVVHNSGKTNLALCAIREHQRLWPDLLCIFIDIEVAFSSDWAMAMGVDVEKLIVVRPDYAEQTVDIVEKFLYADDVGIIVIDSIAAMVTMQELSSSAEKANVGGSSLAVAKLVRKMTRAFGSSNKEERYPTVIWINQIRYQVGVVFGNPETLPGGNGQKFVAFLRIRLSAKAEFDSKISSDVPAVKATKGKITKHKVPVLKIQFEYNMAMIAGPNIEPGRCNNWKAVSTVLKDREWIMKGDKGGWDYVSPVTGEVLSFKTQNELGLHVIQPKIMDGLLKFLLEEHREKYLKRVTKKKTKKVLSIGGK